MRQGLCSPPLLCRVGARISLFRDGFPLFLRWQTYVSARIQLPARIEVVEVEQRVENEEIAADRLAAVHRIVGEQNHVSLAHRRVDHHWPLRDVGPIEQSGHEQIALIAESEDPPGPQRGRNDVQRISQLLIGYRSRLPRLKRLPLWDIIARVQSDSTLRGVKVLNGA